jgi:ADP-ribose pyrophosphatase
MEQDMNFEIENREMVYQGRAFAVYRLAARLPDGRVRWFDLVHHNPSITVIPLTADGKLLFVRQYRLGADKMLLELPAGVLEEGEDPLQGARRELREETGMDATEIRKVGEAYLTPGYCNELMHFYLARDLHPAPLQQDDDEFLDLESYSVAEAFAMARRGEITDSKTLAALFMIEPEVTSL